MSARPYRAVVPSELVDVDRSRFESLVSAGGVALDEGALIVASAVDPTLDLSVEAARLDALAESCTAFDACALADELFGSGRFAGNSSDYYDARNSSLPAVIDRGLGIPISLSVLFVEVGRRRGCTIEGVGMPGHFLTVSDGDFYDPFHAGTKLDAEGCRRVYSRLAGRDVSLPPRALEPTPPIAILQRMLWNLRSIAEGRGDTAMRHRVLALLSTFGDAPLQVRMAWATSLAERGRFDQASAAAEQAAANAPERARERLTMMSERWAARLN